MKKDSKYYLIKKEVIPESIQKVLEAKMLLEQGKVKFVSEAVEKVGISRSVYYKYHDAIEPFFENQLHTAITLGLEVTNDPGVLSSILKTLNDYQVNILTINQNIPINFVANVTITFELFDDNFDVNELIKDLEMNDKLLKVSILARE